MDVKNIGQFDQALAEYAQGKELERNRAVAKHAAEQASIKASQQAALDARRAEQRAIEEKFKQRLLDEEKAEALRKKEENDARVKLEQEQNAVEERLRKERVEASQRSQVLEHQAFLEEQHRKSLVIMREPVEAPEVGEEVSAGAARGTDGSTPKTPLMSEHMRNILRQTNRQD